MLRKIIGAFVGLAYVLVGVRFWRVLQCNRAGTVLTLCGHDPDPKVLDDLLRWLVRRGFAFVDPDELIEMKRGRAISRSRLAWLTFDDGWKGFETRVLPVLERYQAKATIFVPPHEIERGQLWPDSIFPAVPHEKIVELYKLPIAERERQVDEVLARIGNPRRLMTKEELIRLSQHSLITLENHTWSHLSCYHRPVEEVVDEALKAQEILVEWTGRAPKFVCYPYGHYGPDCDEALAKVGLIGVRSDNGLATLETVGRYRNMFRDNMSRFETLGRALDAWPKVRVPDAQNG